MSQHHAIDLRIPVPKKSVAEYSRSRGTRRSRSALWALIIVFLTFGSVYPWLRTMIVGSLGVPSWLSGSWVDAVSLLIVLYLSRETVLSKSHDKISLFFFFGVVAFGIVSAFPFERIEPVFFGVRQTYEPMIFYFAGVWIGQEPDRIRRIGGWYVAVATVAASIGICFMFAFPDYWTGLFVEDVNNSRGWGIGAIARESGLRMTGAFLDPVVFGAVAAWGAAIAFSSQFQQPVKKAWPLFFAVVLCTVGAALSLSRGAWIVVLVCWMVTLILNPRFLFSLRLVAIVLVCSAVVMTVPRSGLIGSAGDDLSNTFDKTVVERNVQREGQFEGALSRFWERPFGLGLGREGHVGERYSGSVLNVDGREFVTDGWYLKILSEGGVFLLVCFVGLMISTIARSILTVTRERDNSLRAYYTCISAITISSTLQSIVTNIWDLYFVSNFLWVVYGVSCGIPKIRRMSRN